MITTASRPLIIPTPRLGFLNLNGDAGDAQEHLDVQALTPFFDSTARGVERPPECDVLFAYVTLREDGEVENSREPLEQIVRLSGAPIIVIASENSGDSYIKGTRWFGSSDALRGGSVNLVMTLERHDPLFGDFFAKLFAQMKDGITMPMAWHALAPQIPGIQHQGPELIFVCGAGHIAFARRPSVFKRLFGG